uniref:Uncharacterized protein n=1 Tax=Gouania willdenowi TaxID=441366 RepID=A0A8C5D0S5_GOUWI
MAERSSCDILTIQVPIRRGGSESNLDIVDGVGLDFTKGALGIDSLQQKILKVTEQMKVEQTIRDQNVAEYLKLVNNADKQQVSRIRQVFEKKNQKSAHTIARLQKKLEHYHRRMKDSDANGKHNHKDAASAKESGTHSKEGSLRDISTGGGGGRHPTLDKVKTLGPGVSLSPPFFFNKSREFANLIRNKFGSADNIAHLKSSMESSSGLQVEPGGRGLSGSATTVAKATTKYHSDDECSTGTSASADSNGNALGGSAAGSGGAGRSESSGRLMEVLDVMREVKEAQTQLTDDMEALSTQFKRDYSYFTQVMQEERYRYERLEDQLNDLTELHQHETSNLKQELASIEEKVAYQAYERARDIQSEYNQSYRVPGSRSVSPQRCLPLAGLRSDHMVHHRREVSVEHKPSKPPAAKPGSPAEPGTPAGPRPAADPPENPGGDGKEVESLAGKKSGKPRPLQPDSQSQPSRPVTSTNDGQQQQQQLDQVDPALWRKAGLKCQRSAGQRSEYQRQFRWRTPAPITSPILTAEQMLYSSSRSNRTFKKHPVPLKTEYQQNYKGLAPPIRPRLREHFENERVPLFQIRRTPHKDRNEKATPPTYRNEKSTPPTERNEKATPPMDINKMATPPTNRNEKATPPTDRNKKDNPYRQEMGSPLKATPPPNMKRQLRNTVGGVASVGDAQQVRELRQEALKYRRRAWGTHFSREHLSQLLSEHNALWEPTETTDSPTNTPQSHPDPSSPSPPSVEALDLSSESSQTSSGGTKRNVETALSVLAERRTTSEDDEDDFTDEEEGRLPTPQLKTRPVQRTHLDLTTPSTGGAILVGRLRKAADWSPVKQRGVVPVSKAMVEEPAPSPPVRITEAWSEVAHTSASSPSPSLNPRSSAKPISLKETPPLQSSVAPPPQRIQGTMRHPDFQHNGELGLRLSCSGKNCGSDEGESSCLKKKAPPPAFNTRLCCLDDRLSVMSWRSAVSCSAASDVLQRALKRRNHFWEKV